MTPLEENRYRRIIADCCMNCKHCINKLSFTQCKANNGAFVELPMICNLFERLDKKIKSR